VGCHLIRSCEQSDVTNSDQTSRSFENGTAVHMAIGDHNDDKLSGLGIIIDKLISYQNGNW